MTSLIHRACSALAAITLFLSEKRLFRWLIGSYLLVHFAQLYASGSELFSSEGMLTAAASPFHVLRLPLFFFDSPHVIQLVLGSAVLASAFLLLGRFDRVAGGWLWLVLASLTTRNPLISNPSLPFMGWLLLAHAVVGWNDPLRGHQLKRAAWIIMSIAYTYSGVTKWGSPSWEDGSALLAILHNPLARDNALKHALIGMPALLKLMTFGTLALETLFAPLAYFQKTRALVWLAMVLAHLGILCLVDFADLTAGMLIVHAFTFDARWLGGDRSASRAPA